jgi:sulfur carrier protein
MGTTITLNGDTVDWQSSGTIGRLLGEHSIDPSHVVVEVNREIVNRDDFDRMPVRDGDVIEILRFVGGG